MVNTEYLFYPSLSETEYDAFARRHPCCNLLQSAPWAQVKAEWLPQRVGLRNRDGELVAACQILKRSFFMGYAMWFIPHGPLLDYEDEEMLRAFLQGLKALTEKEKCLFLRIHPPVPIRAGSIKDFREGEAKEVLPAAYLDRVFEEEGFSLQPRTLKMADTIQPRFQAVIYKEHWEEPPRGKIRYNLRQCERHHVSARPARMEGLDDFARLIRLTEERQGVALRNRDYFQRILEAYGEDSFFIFSDAKLEEAQLDAETRYAEKEKALAALGDNSPKKEHQLREQKASAEKDIRFYQELEALLPEQAGPVPSPSAVMVVRYGRWADMPYAGSDERFDRLPAVWALYVAGIRSAFDAGCERYNLGGLEGTLDDGLTTFKNHFDPVIEETAGEYDFTRHPFLYRNFMKALRHRQARMA